MPGAEGAAGSTGPTQAWRLPKRPPRTHPACPVPASRAKLTMLNTVSKIRGQVKNPGYPQSEGLLGECMIRHGKELGGESNFGEAAGGRAGWRRAGRGVPAQAGRTALPSCRCRSFPRAG